MTNASSTYLSIALGAIVGALISWWVYNIQKKTTAKHDETLRRINDLEEVHRVLKLIQQFQNIRTDFSKYLDQTGRLML